MNDKRNLFSLPLDREHTATIGFLQRIHDDQEKLSEWPLRFVIAHKLQKS